MRICYVPFCCQPHYSCRTIQIFDYIPGKLNLFVSRMNDWMAFWFLYSSQRGSF